MPDHEHRWQLVGIERDERKPHVARVHMHCDCGEAQVMFSGHTDAEIEASFEAQQ